MGDIYLYFLSIDFDRKKRWRDQDDDIKKRGSILPQLAKNRKIVCNFKKSIKKGKKLLNFHGIKKMQRKNLACINI